MNCCRLPVPVRPAMNAMNATDIGAASLCPENRLCKARRCLLPSGFLWQKRTDEQRNGCFLKRNRKLEQIPRVWSFGRWCKTVKICACNSLCSWKGNSPVSRKQHRLLLRVFAGTGRRPGGPVSTPTSCTGQASGHVPRNATRARSKACIRGTWSAANPGDARRVASATQRNAQVSGPAASDGEQRTCAALQGGPLAVAGHRLRRRREVNAGSRSRKTVLSCPSSSAFNTLQTEQVGQEINFANNTDLYGHIT